MWGRALGQQGLLLPGGLGGAPCRLVAAHGCPGTCGLRVCGAGGLPRKEAVGDRPLPPSRPTRARPDSYVRRGGEGSVNLEGFEI